MFGKCVFFIWYSYCIDVLTATLGFTNACVSELNLCDDLTVNHKFGREGADLWVEGQSLGVIGVDD